MYLAGSRSDGAFRSAMASPSPPPPDWGWAAEVVRTTGKLPKDDPEYWFPASILAEWFDESRVQVQRQALEATADGLLEAYTQLFVSARLQTEWLANALPGRDHAGPSLALRRELKAITSSVERLQAALSAIRGELLLHKANGENTAWLAAIHTSFHQEFYEGQHRRQFATGGFSTTGDFDPNAEIGSRATLASTWLEDGLAGLFASAEAATRLKTPPGRTKGHRFKSARDRFVQDVAEVWWKGTGTRPTVQASGDQIAVGRRSAFQQFYEHVCGQVAGLHLRDQQVVWDELGEETQNRVRIGFQSLGLWNVSAPTLGRIVRKMQFDPPPQGSS